MWVILKITHARGEKHVRMQTPYTTGRKKPVLNNLPSSPAKCFHGGVARIWRRTASNPRASHQCHSGDHGIWGAV